MHPLLAPAVVLLLALLSACAREPRAPETRAAAPGPTERRIDVLGVDLRLVEQGPADGPSVLLLHGGRFSAATWVELGTVALLAEAGFRVHAPDLPGRGGTPAAEVADAALVPALVDALGLERAAIVTASYSGRFALPFVCASPERVRGLVALAPIGIDRSLEHLRGSSVPVLAIWGELDETVPVAAGERLVAAVEQGELVVLPGAGHPSYLDAPEAFHAALLEFLRGLPAER